MKKLVGWIVVIGIFLIFTIMKIDSLHRENAALKQQLEQAPRQQTAKLSDPLSDNQEKRLELLEKTVSEMDAAMNRMEENLNKLAAAQKQIEDSQIENLLPEKPAPENMQK